MATIICPNCKTENPGTNQFCQSCGSSLKSSIPAVNDKTVMSKRVKEPAAQTPPPPAASMPPPVIVVPPPPSQGASVPPPVYAAAPVYMGTPMRNLGIRSDGWSDVIAEAADLTDDVKKAFLDEIDAAKLEGVRIAESDLRSGAGDIRKYQVLYNGRGATIVVRVAPFGCSLVVGWDLYTRRTINWLTIGLLAGIVFVCALLQNIIGRVFYMDFFGGFFSFLGVFINWLLVPGLALMLLGKLVKDDWLGYYATDLDEFEADDAVAFSTVVDNALTTAVEKAHTITPKSKK